MLLLFKIRVVRILIIFPLLMMTLMIVMIKHAIFKHKNGKFLITLLETTVEENLENDV